MRALHRPSLRRAALGSALASALGGGCAHSAFDQQLRAGRWQEAQAAFHRDSTLQRNPVALRSLAALHSDPDSATWDPALALELLRRARAYDGGRGGPPDVARLERLLSVLLTEREAQVRSVRALQDSVAQQRAELAWLQREHDERVADGAARESERALLQRLVARLEADLRDRESQLVMLRLELDRLKAIDLTPPARPPRPPS